MSKKHAMKNGITVEVSDTLKKVFSSVTQNAQVKLSLLMRCVINLLPGNQSIYNAYNS